MQYFSQTKTLPFTAQQMYQLVSDIDQYAEFLPWCVASRIKEQKRIEDNKIELLADLIIGFKFYKEKFTSKVILTPNNQIDVEYIKGPFKAMQNMWRFIPLENEQCEVHFEIEFEFNNLFFKKISNLFFEEVATKMIDSFEKRAYSLYK